jgi:hypothetical protein
MDLLELPFHVLRVPQTKLRLPSLSLPSATVVFALVFASYFLVLSGLIYDVIVEPPSIGGTMENGVYKPQAFLEYRINGQYIIEGLTAGSMFAIGALGFIILDRASDKSNSQRNRYLLLLAGALCVLIAYNLCIVFLKKKVRILSEPSSHMLILLFSRYLATCIRDLFCLLAI